MPCFSLGLWTLALALCKRLLMLGIWQPVWQVREGGKENILFIVSTELCVHVARVRIQASGGSWVPFSDCNT